MTALEAESATLRAERDRLREALSDVTERLDHMIRHRHEQAHNGDIYVAGGYDTCALCEDTRASISTATALLTPTPTPETPASTKER